MIKEHTQVVLTQDLPEQGLFAGDVGVVVHIYSDGQAYELEIFTLDGQTVDVNSQDRLHVRTSAPSPTALRL